MQSPRILLADDHARMLEDVRAILTPHYEIVGTVADGRALVEAALRLRPDLIVVDITMPLLNGIDAAVQIKKSLPGMKLLFVTMHSSTAYIEAVFEAGGIGYVLKSGIRDELLEAAQSALNGRIYVSPCLWTERLERFLNPMHAATNPLSVLERKTLQLIAEGKAAKEIADIMNISTETVVFQRRNIKQKLGLSNTAELTNHWNNHVRVGK